MKHKLILLAILIVATLSNIYSQSTTITLDYQNNNTLNPTLCNEFLLPGVKVNNIVHSSYAGGVSFVNNIGLRLYTIPVSNTNGVNKAGTAYIINYPFKPNYKYSYSITAQGNIGFTIGASVPSDLSLYPTQSTTSCNSDGNVPNYSTTNSTGVSEPVNSVNITTYQSKEFTISGTATLYQLLVWAYGGKASLAIDALDIYQITITETPPPLSFSITPPSISIAPCQTLTNQTFTVNQSGTATGTVAYNWKVGAGWLYNGATPSAVISTSTNSIQLTNIPNLSSYGNVVVDVLVNSVVTTTQTCSVSTSTSSFSLAPQKFEVDCGQAKTQTFTVTKTNADFCNVTYVWYLGTNNGWQYNGIDAPSTITTSSNTLTLTTLPTAATISDVGVNVLVNGISVGKYNCGSSISTPTYNYSISGNPVICNSEIYSIPGLPTGASVIWSVESANPNFVIKQNTPIANQATISNNKYFGTSVKLYAKITGLSSCPAPTILAKQISNDNELSINKSYNFVQQQCSYYGVSHNSITGSIISNAAPVFVHQGCMVFVDLGYLNGATVSVNPQPAYWSLGTSGYFSGTTLMFNLGLYSGGIPYTFTITNNAGGACYKTRTLLFFSMAGNGRMANPNRFVITKHPTISNTLTIGLNQYTTDEQAKLFFDATALAVEQVQTVVVYDKEGNKVLVAENIGTQVANIDVSTLPEGVYNIEVYGNNDYREQQTIEIIDTKTDQQIAEDVANGNIIISSQEATKLNEVLQQELFQKLKSNASLTDNSTVLQNFLLTKEQSGLGTIEKINEALSNYDVATAQTLINSWLPTTNLELNSLQYYNYFIKYLTGGTFSDDEMSDMFSFANLCPQKNGEVIYAARSLYNYITQSDEQFESACGNNYARGAVKINASSGQRSMISGITIYPNPAKDNFNIKFPATTKGLNTIKVVDMFGKTLLQKSTIGGTQTISLSFGEGWGGALAKGIYTVQITNSVTGKTETQKLIIQ